MLLASCAQDCLIRIWGVFTKGAGEDGDNEDMIRLKEDAFDVKVNGASLHGASSRGASLFICAV